MLKNTLYWLGTTFLGWMIGLAIAVGLMLAFHPGELVSFILGYTLCFVGYRIGDAFYVTRPGYLERQGPDINYPLPK